MESARPLSNWLVTLGLQALVVCGQTERCWLVMLLLLLLTVAAVFWGGARKVLFFR